MRAKARIGLKNLAYNMRRLVQLERHAMAPLGDNRKDKQDFVADVENFLESFAGPDGLRLPSRSHIVVAEP